jgi:hypothetical protein
MYAGRIRLRDHPGKAEESTLSDPRIKLLEAGVLESSYI